MSYFEKRIKDAIAAGFWAGMFTGAMLAFMSMFVFLAVKQ